MASSSTDIFLSKPEQERLRTLLEKTGTVSDYLAKAAEYISKGQGLAEAINKAAPWLKDIAESASEAFPIVKFIASLGEKWLPRATHPADVGAVACTLVYQKLADKAIRNVCTSALQYPLALKIDDQVVDGIKALPPAEAADLSTFSWDTALQHGFIRNADGILDQLMLACEFDEKQRRRVFDEIHDQFVPELKALLTHEKTAAKFASFKAFVESGTEERQTLVALRLHAKYQIAQYESEPLFKSEPYALKDIYVETECGKLTWTETRPTGDNARPDRDTSIRPACDPFSENHGGRHDLLSTVMAYIKDEKFREAIVVQGTAGAGKSSFTLRLCAQLWEEGFHPLRIRFKRLQLGASLLEALNDALELSDDDEATELPIARPKDMLRDGHVFDTPWGGNAGLSRYVLILDGWDELDLTDNKSFRDKVSEVLREVRQRFLNAQKTPRIRVIVTGRPSSEVSESRFLYAETPILTLRPLRPEQVQNFISRLKDALATKPVHVEQTEEWKVADPEAFTDLVRRYQEFFAESLPEYDQEGNMVRPGQPPSSGSFEVVGLPLLAYLTVRVLSEMAAKEVDAKKRQDLFEQMGHDPTALYRCLTDLTCGKAGKAAQDLRDSVGDLERQAREKGMKLREKLQFTAAAMTIGGKEYISYGEWAWRVNVLSKESITTEQGKGEDHPLAKLMISYYFKGGHRDQSCEFAHKSFREYLFAEAIVETLKSHARDKPRRRNPERPEWRDFSRDEDLFEFSRSLAELLSPQWLTTEVYGHLFSLLRWEINRGEPGELSFAAGIKVQELTIEKWQQVANGLAEVWSWWVDGAHLRPQMLKDRAKMEPKPPYVHDLALWAAGENPTDKTPLESATTLDAHFGDALCQVTAMVHYLVAERQKRNGIEVPPFAPGGTVNPTETGATFKRVIARIAGASGRPGGDFPINGFLARANLKDANLWGANLWGADLSGANLSGADL
ncbi:MAG TPA: pentapeptide repeat-containing protein, partial [Polyangium sp.]|nr:pentapeptide repeat-containing protein [Polyangium sp.]